MGLPLAVDGLVVSGDRGRTILQIERLEASPGICLGVRGASGAGKSTLLFALAGLVPRASGSVRWGKTDMLKLGEAGCAAFRRVHVGMIFQDFSLFEELGPAANAAIAAAYAPAPERAEISKRAAAMLDRLALKTDRGRTVTSFSGGERQRVAIARALAHDPDIILADEPTASLDREAADRLIDDLVKLARDTGKTLIAVSHDAGLQARMDRLIDIADGRLRQEEPLHA